MSVEWIMGAFFFSRAPWSAFAHTPPGRGKISTNNVPGGDIVMMPLSAETVGGSGGGDHVGEGEGNKATHGSL